MEVDLACPYTAPTHHAHITRVRTAALHASGADMNPPSSSPSSTCNCPLMSQPPPSFPNRALRPRCVCVCVCVCPCVRSASGASNLRPVASNLRCLTLKEELSKREKKKQLLALSSEKRRLAKGARPCALALPVPLLCALARLLPNAVRVQMVCAHMAMRQQGVCWRRARMRLATPCTGSGSVFYVRLGHVPYANSQRPGRSAARRALALMVRQLTVPASATPLVSQL